MKMDVNGFIFWTHSPCRSVLGFIKGLSKYFNKPVKIFTAMNPDESRRSLGWPVHEFSNMEIMNLENDQSKIDEILRMSGHCHHFFTGYQNIPILRYALKKANDLDLPVAAFSEAPLNMFVGYKRYLKKLYLDYWVSQKIASLIKPCRFLINLSGDDALACQRIGWPVDNIIPCGYFPPPLVDSYFVCRDSSSWEDFHILFSGVPTWHRGPDVFMKSLKLLKEWNCSFRVTITGEGHMMTWMKSYAENYGLSQNIVFAGFVSYEKLLELYESCSCFVASGRYEPWGIRVNDALLAGSPIVVSRGMGAHKLVNDYDCGQTFGSEDYVDLAHQLNYLITDSVRYDKVNENVKLARNQALPDVAGARVGKIIEQRFGDWLLN